MSTERTLVRSGMTLRKAVGWIGILLPFVLILGNGLLFHEDFVQRSISHFYHSPMRDLFVGALCAVGLFLLFYTGPEDADDWLGNIAGILAIATAWIPTTDACESTTTGIIHLVCAASLFICLAIFCLFYFVKTCTEPGYQMTSRKKTRNKVYRTCGTIMLLCLAAIVIYLNVTDCLQSGSFIFWAEAVALVAFGVSWLTKSEAILGDH